MRSNKNLDEVLKFREVFYKAGRSGARCNDLAAMLAFSLIGSSYLIPSCCILAFCKAYWVGVPLRHKHPTGSHMLCGQCLLELTKKEKTMSFPDDVDSLRLTPEMIRAIQTVRKLRERTDEEIADEIMNDEILRDVIEEIHMQEELGL